MRTSCGPRAAGRGQSTGRGSCTSEHAFGRQAIDCWNGRSQGVSRGAAVRETLAHAPLNHVELHRHTLLLSSRAALYLRDQRSHCEQAGAESPRSHSSRVGCGLLIVCCSIVPCQAERKPRPAQGQAPASKSLEPKQASSRSRSVSGSSSLPSGVEPPEVLPARSAGSGKTMRAAEAFPQHTRQARKRHEQAALRRGLHGAMIGSQRGNDRRHTSTRC